MMHYVLGFQILSSLQELQSPNSSHLQRHLLWSHFCFELHTLSFNLYLHPHNWRGIKNLVSFILYVKYFCIHIFTLSGTHTRAYGSSVVFQLSSYLLTFIVNV